MCGLFGLLRCPDDDHPGHASQVFVLLGVLAEERGRDAAGVALLSGRPAGAPAPERPGRFPDLRMGGCRVVKGLGRFTRVWQPELEPALDKAVLALGHTRWATQGGRRLVNASPIVTSRLVGTHNGDVDAGRLRARFGLPEPAGDTDTEMLYLALDAAAGTAATVEVLRSVEGRAALAWASRARPGRVHLARTALNPMAIAIDTERNLYWASNPQWLRIAEAETPVRFTRKVLLAEGTYLAVQRGSRPRLVAEEQFVPVAREQDRHCEGGIWRGFTAADRAKGRRLQRHVVAPPADRVRQGRPLSAASG